VQVPLVPSVRHQMKPPPNATTDVPAARVVDGSVGGASLGKVAHTRASSVPSVAGQGAGVASLAAVAIASAGARKDGRGGEVAPLARSAVAVSSTGVGGGGRGGGSLVASGGIGGGSGGCGGGGGCAHGGGSALCGGASGPVVLRMAKVPSQASVEHPSAEVTAALAAVRVQGAKQPQGAGGRGEGAGPDPREPLRNITNTASAGGQLASAAGGQRRGASLTGQQHSRHRDPVQGLVPTAHHSSTLVAGGSHILGGSRVGPGARPGALVAQRGFDGVGAELRPAEEPPLARSGPSGPAASPEEARRGGSGGRHAVGALEPGRRSYVARTLDSRRDFRGCPDDDIDAVLGEFVDSVLRHCHLNSKRHQPNVAMLQIRFRDAERGPVLNWLVQACDEMQFHETVLFTTILMLDRYCAMSKEESPMARSVLMAVICTALKTQAVQDEVCNTMPFREQLSYMCHKQIPIEEILSTEHQVLRVLQFNVTVPTALEFLDILSAPLLSPEADSSPPRCLANFLVQLSLFDVELHYRYPHAILAASAIYVALACLKASSVILRAILDDVAIACSTDVADVPGVVASCSEQLLILWKEFAATGFERVPSIMRKFAGVRLDRAFISHPPSPTELPHPYSVLPGLGRLEAQARVQPRGAATPALLAWA